MKKIIKLFLFMVIFPLLALILIGATKDKDHKEKQLDELFL